MGHQEQEQTDAGLGRRVAGLGPNKTTEPSKR